MMRGESGVKREYNLGLSLKIRGKFIEMERLYDHKVFASQQSSWLLTLIMGTGCPRNKMGAEKSLRRPR